MITGGDRQTDWLLSIFDLPTDSAYYRQAVSHGEMCQHANGTVPLMSPIIFLLCQD